MLEEWYRSDILEQYTKNKCISANLGDIFWLLNADYISDIAIRRDARRGDISQKVSGAIQSLLSKFVYSRNLVRVPKALGQLQISI